MGLDIYLMKPIKIEKKFRTLDKMQQYLDENYKNFCLAFDSLEYSDIFDELKKRFNEYVVKTKGEVYDFKKYFQDRNLDPNKYRIISISNDLFEFEHINTGEIISISEYDVETYFQDIEVIFFEEIGYQRYGMKDEFWKEVIKDCWYMTPEEQYDENQGLDCIFTKQDFENLIKKYCEDDAPALEWDFKEGEMMIYLSY